jgi:predicted nucleotidyltransferase
MGSYAARFTNQGKIQPPKFLACNVHYEALMGSHAYGVNTADSDMDIYGWCIPPKAVVFPHLAGEIPGFGTQKKAFGQFEGSFTESNGKDYDLSIYSVVKYFHLVMGGNPNMVDSLFVPEDCVLHCTQIGALVRENRRLFLSKKVWHTFKGYGFSQMHKIKHRNPHGKRKVDVEKYGYDVKFAYHAVRLMNEVEQILAEGDVDLRRSSDQLKAIRRGEVPLDYIERTFADKQVALEKLYAESELPHKPREREIRDLLYAVLEKHYESLDGCVVRVDAYQSACVQIQSILDGLHA